MFYALKKNSVKGRKGPYGGRTGPYGGHRGHTAAIGAIRWPSGADGPRGRFHRPGLYDLEWNLKKIEKYVIKPASGTIRSLPLQPLIVHKTKFNREMFLININR